MKYSFIQLRFLKADKPASEDYVINIKRNGDDYMWMTRDEIKHRVQVMWIEEEDVWKQLELMIQVLKWDVDPYSSMQVFLPALPSVLIRMENLENAFGDLRRLMQMSFDNWPENMSHTEALKLDSDDVYEDDDYEDADSESDEDSDDTSSESSGYTDMPKLVSQDMMSWWSKPIMSEYEAADVLSSMKDCADCPCTPRRSKTAPVCPGAPARKPRNEVVDMSQEDASSDDTPPAKNTRSSKNATTVKQQLYRKVENLPCGKQRVHTFFA